MQESNTLDRAREYETKHRAARAERPVFHITAPVGWCNDPNGWSCYQGQYHLFYQYHPYSKNWGPMHWGHAVTADFLTWKDLPCALAPDSSFDAAGCFSGGAIEWKGRQLVLYTGVMKEGDGEIQQQCLALGDGENYQKAAHVVIDCEQQPEGFSRRDFRDPCLFEKNGILYALIAGRGSNGHGRLLLYSNAHPEDSASAWEYVQTIAENDGSLGSMWECPNIFELDGKTVIIISPQFAQQARDNRYHCGNDTAALIGHWGGPNTPFVQKSDSPLDYGLDFYAPQTLLTPDGRRVMIGWMQNWDHCYPEDRLGWYGQMTLPRELFWQDDVLCQRPVRELDQARRLRVSHENVAVSGQSVALDQVRGRVLDCDIEVHVEQAQRFGIRFACGDGHWSEVRMDFDDKVLRIDRRHAGGCRDALELREVPLVQVNDTLRLRMVLDRYSAEFFLQDGRQVASMTIYPTAENADRIEFFAKGTCTMNLKLYDLALGEDGASCKEKTV